MSSLRPSVLCVNKFKYIPKDSSGNLIVLTDLRNFDYPKKKVFIFFEDMLEPSGETYIHTIKGKVLYITLMAI